MSDPFYPQRRQTWPKTTLSCYFGLIPSFDRLRTLARAGSRSRALVPAHASIDLNTDRGSLLYVLAQAGGQTEEGGRGRGDRRGGERTLAVAAVESRRKRNSCHVHFISERKNGGTNERTNERASERERWMDETRWQPLPPPPAWLVGRRCRRPSSFDCPFRLPFPPSPVLILPIRGPFQFNMPRSAAGLGPPRLFTFCLSSARVFPKVP